MATVVEGAHDDWVARTLGDLKSKSHNRPIWDGEVTLARPETPPAPEYSDPHASRVFTTLVEASQSRRRSKDQPSKQRAARGTSRRASLHMGLARAVGSKRGVEIEEPAKGAGKGAGAMPKPSKDFGLLRQSKGCATADDPVFKAVEPQGMQIARPPTATARRVSLADFAGVEQSAIGVSILGQAADAGVMMRLGKELLSRVACQGELQHLAEAIDSVDREDGERLPHFAWIRNCPPHWSERGDYPSIEAQIDDGLIGPMCACFDKDELETLFDMFDHYAFELHSKLVMLERELVDCLYWVNVKPNAVFVQFCIGVVSKHATDGFLFDESGEKCYSLSNMFRWMLHYRLRSNEEFVRKAAFTDKAVAFMRDQFAPFDPEGRGLKTKQVFEVLDTLSHRPQSVEDQKRVIAYISEVDLDKSGTIDFHEFLQIMRLLMEYEVGEKRAQEKDAFSGCGFLPNEVDSLRIAFSAFDDTRTGGTSLQNFKRMLQRYNVNPGRAQMQHVVEVLSAVTGCKASECKSVRFIDFVRGMRTFVDSDAPGMRDAFQQILTKGVLSQWVRCATPSPDELRGRWDLMMAEPHQNRFLQVMLKDLYEPIEHTAEFGSQAPSMLSRRTSKDKTAQNSVGVGAISWDLLEGDADAELDDDSD